MRTMNLNAGVKFARQFKQPFEEKELIAEILEDNDSIKISIDKAKHGIMKMLSDELTHAMMCESSEYINECVVMYNPDYGMFDVNELKQFIEEFMKEYNVTIKYKI